MWDICDYLSLWAEGDENYLSTQAFGFENEMKMSFHFLKKEMKMIIKPNFCTIFTFFYFKKSF